MDSLLFIFFSFVEGISVVYLMLSIYRLRMSEFLFPSLGVILIQCLQSYFLRGGDISLPYLVPVVNIFLFVFLLTAIIRIPIIWSCFIAITGYVAYGLIQSLIVFLSFGLVTIELMQSNSVVNYSVMSISSVSAFLIARILFRFGIGFSFDFDKLKFKWERVLLIGIIVTTLVSIAALLQKKDNAIVILFLIISTSFFIYYSIRKETS
ncbi:hypothetical protein AB6A23_05435 [Paenibacillus tarimensis]